MHILITGASGIIGQNLIKHYLNLNYTVTIFSYTNKATSKNKKLNIIPWDPEKIISTNSINSEQKKAFQQINLLINLSGESIANGRLNKSLKKRILQSRIHATKALIYLMNETNHHSFSWVQMSGIGYSGSQKNKKLTENSPQGTSFLANVCHEHETLIQKHVTPIIKQSIILRLSLVLAKDAPAWKKIKFPISLGLGSALGSGQQYWSWIHIDDVIGAIQHLTTNSQSAGIYNLTAPKAETQKNFTKIVAKHLKKPMFLPPAPAWILRIIVGEAIDELILPSQHVIPEKLNNINYSFKYPTLYEALKNI